MFTFCLNNLHLILHFLCTFIILSFLYIHSVFRGDEHLYIYPCVYVRTLRKLSLKCPTKSTGLQSFLSILNLNIPVLFYCYKGCPHSLPPPPPPPQMLTPILFSFLPWSATWRRQIGERCDHYFITYDLDIILFTLTFRFIYYIISLFHGIEPF